MGVNESVSHVEPGLYRYQTVRELVTFSPFCSYFILRLNLPITAQDKLTLSHHTSSPRPSLKAWLGTAGTFKRLTVGFGQFDLEVGSQAEWKINGSKITHNVFEL